MRAFICLIALLVVPFVALADGNSMVVYTSADHSFALGLPSAGTIRDANDPDWESNGSTVFTWEAAGEAAPLSFATLNVIAYDDDATDADVDAFMDDELSDDNLTHNKAELKSTGDPLTLGGHVWSNARFK